MTKQKTEINLKYRMRLIHRRRYATITFNHLYSPQYFKKQSKMLITWEREKMKLYNVYVKIY